MALIILVAVIGTAFVSLGLFADRFGADSRDSFDETLRRGVTPRWT